MKKNKILLLFVFICFIFKTKADSTFVFTLPQFFSSVLKYHPLAKQADLLNLIADANLLQSRGSFDPVINGQFENKTFDNKNYWQQLLTEINIPTWYGLQPKIGYEFNDGIQNTDNTFKYLSNEKSNLPNGLFYAGIKANLGAGFILDERRATLKQAKLFIQQNKFERDNAINNLMFDAFDAYSQWNMSANKIIVLENALATGQLRFEAISKLSLLGDIAGIDTLETLTQMMVFQMMLNDAKIEFQANKYKINSFLWDEAQNPIFLEPNIVPQSITPDLLNISDTILKSNSFKTIVQNHPKIKSIEFKYDQLEIEERLKENKLLPKLDLNYNVFLNDVNNNPPLQYSSYSQNYKLGIDFTMPIFLREQRGNLALTRLKLTETDLILKQTENEIINKSLAYQQQIQIFTIQKSLIEKMIINYQRLLESENIKFDLGESSVFLVNSREQKLFESQIKLFEIEYKYLKSLASLKWSLGLWIN